MSKKEKIDYVKIRGSIGIVLFVFTLICLKIYALYRLDDEICYIIFY